MFSVYYALEAYIIEEETMAKLSTHSFIGGGAGPKKDLKMLNTKVLVKVIQPPLSVNPPKSIKLECKLTGAFRDDQGLAQIEMQIDK